MSRELDEKKLDAPSGLLHPSPANSPKGLLSSTAGLCNGSTADSESACLGSNPSPATNKRLSDIRLSDINGGNPPQIRIGIPAPGISGPSFASIAEAYAALFPGLPFRRVASPSSSFENPAGDALDLGVM